MNFADFIAGELSYLNTAGTPKISGIRNLTQQPDKNNVKGYTYLFEAKVNGNWVEYGPIVCGNFSVRRDIDDIVFPEHDSLYKKTCTRTIYLGMFHLDKLYSYLQ